MDFIVKNTTIRELFELLCPHYCLLCGSMGSVLCDECKNYNIDAQINICLKCGVVIFEKCNICKTAYSRSWTIGYRDEKLGVLVEQLKYKSVRALAWPLAEMLDAAVPCLPDNTIVVPVPTIRSHVRARGLDHTYLLAKNLAKMRKWKVSRVVGRATNSVQVGSTAKRRFSQARLAYCLAKEIKEKQSYLVIDDVATTGASIDAVCSVLKDGGAKNIVVAVITKSEK